MRRLEHFALWACALALVACDDTTPGSSGPEEIDASVDAGLCAHTGEPISVEVCDNVDNDCDRMTDEDFDLLRDPLNCGACGVVCDYGNGVATCRDGECAFGGCPEGTYDADGDHENGCEVTCSEAAGEEICDGEDNDCDGEVDEGFDLRLDPLNCGACGVACAYENGQGVCDLGVCALASCEVGWGDLDGDDENGCEAQCAPENPGPEVCDGEDNDCDGQIDEGFELSTDGENCGACGVICAYANGIGACVTGGCQLVGCQRGYANADGRLSNGCEAVCEQTAGGVEICDEVDNDCNGVIDDGIDKLSDVQNCGGCGRLDEAHICRLPNAEVVCVEGACRVGQCVAGFADQDGAPANGCEAICEVSNEGVEICDGLDNDCDGAVDEGFALDADPLNCGACGEACEAGNATPGCDAGRCVIAACPEGFVDADQSLANGCEYACAPTDDPAEICDGLDNDCDGDVDEGFDVFNDLEHCGGCGQRCAPAHALALCNSGVCDIGGCEDGWFDANGVSEDGCEIECTPSEDGFEICDGLDNDCDGQIDEGFDLLTDDFNCGACGDSCWRDNGSSACVDGACLPIECRDGWHDLNGDLEDGCEYPCIPSEDPAEVCDAYDNDCDGQIDEGFDLSGSLEHCGGCNVRCALAHAEEACVDGICTLLACEAGFMDTNNNPLDGCESDCTPSPDGEICNGQDDDCDGLVDEDFRLDSDPSNCGACGHVCETPSAQPFCNDGACAVLACAEGFVDLDGEAGNGCECALSNGGQEICNEIDDDCNGLIDDRVVPPEGFDCLSLGVCRGASAICDAGAWACDYPDSYEALEARCDGLDNDCNGEIDEPFIDDDLGHPCDNGELGVCREVGVIECDGPHAVACSAASHADRAAPEICNDEDDDCDGEIDEDSQALVTVAASGGVGAFNIFAYEASRADADALDVGQSFARACSKPDALPWINVDYATAEEACAASGCALCSAEQWTLACAGPGGQLYPYGNAYQADACNGQDFDADAQAAGNQDLALPGGAMGGCARAHEGGDDVYDLSGNVWEWTTQASAEDVRTLRGGGYGNIAGGLTCGFPLASPEDTARENVGFRCCCPL